MRANLTKRTIGLNFEASGRADIRVWAPRAEQVSLVLAEGEYLKLQQEEFGYWSLVTDKVKPGDLYQFVLNGDTFRPDPASLAQQHDVHGFSVAKDVNAFKWEDQQWKNIPMKDYLLYELHTGTFSDEGTFSGIEEKLDHLLDLGVTAIEIMPVAQFPGGRNWGYDGVLPFAVQNSYGGMEGLQHLVNTCHKKGLAVVLDVVYNHIGPEGNYLGDFGFYFTDKYHTPWGDAINFDDAWCDAVRQFFIENALMWFRDFHIDALRLDAVHAIKDFSPVHILRELKFRVNELMELTGQTYHLIAEVDLNDTRYINPLEQQGFGMDAQWIDEFHHALRVASGEDRTGYYADFNGLEHLAKSYRDAYVYDGQYSPHRHKFFGVKTSNPGSQFIVFSQNHDQVGNRMLGERPGELVGFEMQKLTAAAVMVSPFLPMLFMGEEWAEPNPFLYFVSHTDPDLAEAVRKGRKAEFAAFHGAGEAPDPMDAATFLKSKLQWDLPNQHVHQLMLNYYKKLIQLRKQHPVLSDPDRNAVQAEPLKEKGVLILTRRKGERAVICLMNFSDNMQQVPIDGADNYRHLLMNSAAPEWGGAFKATVDPGGVELLDIAPRSVLIYEK